MSRGRMAALLLLAAAAGPGCATAVEHGRVLAGGEGDPFVTVEAGNVQFRGGRFFARYAADRATHTCWLIIGNSLAPMECCDLRRVEALRPVITWESDASCASAGGGLGPTPAPAPPAPPPEPAPAPPPT